MVIARAAGKRPAPGALGKTTKPLEPLTIIGDTKIGKVPTNLTTEPHVLSTRGPVHHLPALRTNAFQRPRQSLLGHQLPQYPLAFPRFPPEMDETEKVKPPPVGIERRRAQR